jgi:hypothetical protein
MNTKREEDRWDRRLARSSYWGAVMTLILIVAGLLGSLYPDDIKGAIPRLGFKPFTRAVIFWGTALIGALMFYVRQRASDHARAASERRLTDRAKELGTLITTMPPADFLSRCQTLHWESSAAVNELLKTPVDQMPRGEIERTIRVLLNGVAMLAHHFDAARSDSHYAANLMIFVASESFESMQLPILRAKLFFAEPDVDLLSLAGVLDLNLMLSATSEPGNDASDPELQPFALPVPSKTESDLGISRVLPGAPRAFVQRAPDIYRDTMTLADWCQNEGDFGKSVTRQVREYFTNRQFRSFVSLPLYWPDKIPIAVLNIHRDAPGILRSDANPESSKHFIDVTAPLRTVLLTLVERLFERERLDSALET